MAFGGDLPGEGDGGGIVGGDGRGDPPFEEGPDVAGESAVDVSLGPEDDLGTFPVAALHDPDPGAGRREALDVGGPVAQVGLEDDSHVGRPVGVAELLEDGDRPIDVGRLLHVDPDEDLLGNRRVQRAPEIAQAGGVVDVEADLGRLDRDVRIEAFGPDSPDRRDDVVRRGVGCGRLMDVGPDMVQGAPDPAGLELAKDLDPSVEDSRRRRSARRGRGFPGCSGRPCAASAAWPGARPVA